MVSSEGVGGRGGRVDVGVVWIGCVKSGGGKRRTVKRRTVKRRTVKRRTVKRRDGVRMKRRGGALCCRRHFVVVVVRCTFVDGRSYVTNQNQSFTIHLRVPRNHLLLDSSSISPENKWCLVALLKKYVRRLSGLSAERPRGELRVHCRRRSSQLKNARKTSSYSLFKTKGSVSLESQDVVFEVPPES